MIPLCEPPVFRPPSEADSLILQATIGCSHNRCAFCGMYATKRFRIRTDEEIRADIDQARAALGPGVRRVFLADGDALCLSPRRLTAILDLLNAAFPQLQRIGAYANARDVLSKTGDELAALRSRKLRMLYVGLESGDPETLEAIDKGATPGDIVEAVRRARLAGMTVSVMVLIGLAGVERSLEHARRSAEAINQMAPEFTALLTYTPVPGTALCDRIGSGLATLPSPRGSLDEIRTFVDALECQTYFTCNHASNYLPMTGRMPQSKAKLIGAIDAALAGHVAIRPECLRGL
ncbi:MAG: radical SAM protein [Acidobacteriota bacterium]